MINNNKVNIRPNVSILSVLKFLEYETWFALAEFVDNSIDSFQKNEAKIKKANGNNYQLNVEIELNDEENKIIIRDNAAGIEEHNYARAFRAAEIPTDTTGLSEFGMGMKSAACWFSDYWIVRTTAIGEQFEKTVIFDMNKIFEDKLEELEYTTKPIEEDIHYTVIELYKVNRMPRRRGIGKVKEHLTSIYREFIRNGTLKLVFDNTTLEYKEPKILKAPYFKKPNEPIGNDIVWKKEIDFPIEDDLSVKGFVAIREKASTNEAGFALFRRGRVIEGSFDNGFRPDYIFGAPNSYKYQRVFGELHLIGFDVAFTKKGIQWDENLDIFLQLLRDDISNDSFPLLQQAENYRVRATKEEYKKAGEKALKDTVRDFKENGTKAIKETFDNSKNERNDIQTDVLPETNQKEFQYFEVEFNHINWIISIELSYENSIDKLYEVGSHLVSDKIEDKDKKQVGIRLSLTHPFMVQFIGTDNTKIEAILRIVAALGLSEVIAKESGAKTQGEIRRNLNDLITKISIKNI